MRIWLSRPHMGGQEKFHVEAAFDSNFIAPIGPQLTGFEEAVSDYLGGGLHCVALSSGSAALHLAIRLADVGQNDSIWISSMTFAGGIFPALYQGAIPEFFDLDPKSWTIDCDLLEDKLATASANNTLPKAIIPTDLYGQSSDLDRLETLCEQYEVSLIVDSAESLGASYKGDRKCGTGGDAAILSFNGNKIITTSGGGMLVTKHREMAEQARFLATQARDPAPHYEHSTYGYNYRLSNVCAAIGLGQMEVLDQRVSQRRRIFDRYKETLAPLGITFMPEPDGYYSSRWLTTVSINPEKLGVSREDIRLMLMEHEIESRPLWKPMHMQPLFQGTTYHGSGVDEDLFEQGLCLPSGSDMTEGEQGEVIDRISDLLRRA